MADFLSKMPDTKPDTTQEIRPASPAEEAARQISGRIDQEVKKQSRWAGRISAVFYNINQFISFFFDSLLFYTPDDNYPTPELVGFFIKILLIISSYIAINISLFLIYACFIPVFYAAYLKSYSNFQQFLRNQKKAFNSKFGVKLLEKADDPKTVGILALFDSVVNPDINTAKNIDEYKTFINKDIKDAIDKYMFRTEAQAILNYFMGLPDEFEKYAKRKESYIYISIQYWVVMLCIILFVIPIKYVIHQPMPTDS
ncbi:hypothetical protein EBQ91_00495 [bacterium]|jgi:hypothetical protein|nr:hypothetical protein [bacterium]